MGFEGGYVRWGHVFLVRGGFPGCARFGVGFVEDLDLDNSSQRKGLVQKKNCSRGKKHRGTEGGFTSNCHLSTFSPVSLLVMTTTSLEILPPVIHLLSCDMIFLI